MFRFTEEQQSKKTRTKAHKERTEGGPRYTGKPTELPGHQGLTKVRGKVNSKAHHGPKQDPVKSEPPGTTKHRHHSTQGNRGRTLTKLDITHMVFFSYVG